MADSLKLPHDDEFAILTATGEASQKKRDQTEKETAEKDLAKDLAEKERIEKERQDALAKLTGEK